MSDMEPRAKTLAKTLRQMAGDGSIEWLHESIRVDFLLDIANALDENEELRKLVQDTSKAAHMLCQAWEGSCSKDAEGMSLHAVCPIGDTSELCVFGNLYERMKKLRINAEQ
jgi:hypothetical protein